MKVLIIEDDPATVTSLRRGLRTYFIVDAAKTGAEGVHKAEVGDYDAIILDLGLPDMTGLEVCRVLRSKPSSSPIMVLTAVADVQMKVDLLDAGADDYITKVFRLEELKARLRVLARRGKIVARSSVLMAGDLRLDTASRQVERAGRPIRLRRKEFDLLEYLMYNRNRVISRIMIIEHVWDVNESPWTNAVDVHIKYLRDKIDRPFDVPLIKTIHGVGYMLEVPVKQAVAAGR